MEFKDALKLIRKKRNLTQPELAKKIGKEKQSIIRYETGKGTPDVATFQMLCKVLEVSEYELMGKMEYKEYTTKHNKTDKIFNRTKSILTLIEDCSIYEQEIILNICKESLKLYNGVV